MESVGFEKIEGERQSKGRMVKEKEKEGSQNKVKGGKRREGENRRAKEREKVIVE